MHRRAINLRMQVIHPGKSPVTVRMSLEISSVTGAWHKGAHPAVRMMRAPAKRRTIAGVMQAGTPPDPNMSELLAEVGRTHDVELFEALFRHFAPRVKAYMARTGSPGVAEELMQETMVSVWNKAAMYDPGKGAASTWIFSIARNLRIDAYRREKHPEYAPADPAFQPEAAPAADHQLEGEAAAEIVRRALDTLPADQAEVLRLAYFEDNSQSTIAEALSLPLGTVKSRLRLAFAKLRDALGREGD